MAALASAALDIPKTLSSAREAHVSDRSAIAAGPPFHVLPTPPNSISPALPAHGLKAQLRKAKLDPIDSDLDLQDNAGTSFRRPLSPVAHDASGAITSLMLAKCHLPEILLNHGPLAIRHIMGYLTTSVPGFSGIPPTKARRLVVAALEAASRGDGAGLDGDVDFAKVGWGRWDARRRGSTTAAADGPPSTPPRETVGGIPILAPGTRRPQARTMSAMDVSAADELMHFSHDDGLMHAMESEADKMSLDGSASASCSEAPDDDVPVRDDPEDVTDDEDWAAMGAAALRADSYPSMAAYHGQPPDLPGPGAMRFFSASSGMARPPPPGNLAALPLGDAPPDVQEQEAVEALLRLGSV